MRQIALVTSRCDGYGVFAKIRAGVNHYSDAFASANTTAGTTRTRGSNVTAVDVGGVVERYVRRRWLIRFDGGDVISIFHPTTIVINGATILAGVPTHTDSIRLGRRRRLAILAGLTSREPWKTRRCLCQHSAEASRSAQRGGGRAATARATPRRLSCASSDRRL
jgi:hypothetical protein